MRTYFTLLVAVIALFARSGVASAVSASSPTKLAPLNPGFQTENNSARFLRKRIEDESDDVNTEERGVWTDYVKMVKKSFGTEQRLANRFKKTDEELYKKNRVPGYLADAVKKLEKGGWPQYKIDEFKDIAERYSKYWYRNFPDSV